MAALADANYREKPCVPAPRRVKPKTFTSQTPGVASFSYLKHLEHNERSHPSFPATLHSLIINSFFLFFSAAKL